MSGDEASGSLKPGFSYLKKSKLDMNDSRQLSLHLHSLSRKYQKPSSPLAGAHLISNTPPIIVDLEESSSSSKSQSNNDEVIRVSSESESEFLFPGFQSGNVEVEVIKYLLSFDGLKFHFCLDSAP